MSAQGTSWRQLKIAVIGGGIGGLAVATSLRRAGHKVTIYEQGPGSSEGGASISCGANGSKWLEVWEVDINLGKPSIIRRLIRHALDTGIVQDVYDLSGYSKSWGYEYLNFFRPDMHAMLLEAATGAGRGEPAIFNPYHVCEAVDHDTGTVTLQSGVKAKYDLVVGADGVGSVVRRDLGNFAERQPATSICYHCVIDTSDIRKLQLPDMSANGALEYWGGHGLEKIVFAPCRNGDIHSFYVFFPSDKDKGSITEEGWHFSGSREQLLAPFPYLDPALQKLFMYAKPIHIRPWRLFVHQPYNFWYNGQTCLLGDAAHPMLPDQSQGACQAIEDAAALGIIFGPSYSYTTDITAGLQLYERVRKPRASRIQAASARARENISERIGFSSQRDSKWYKIADEDQKLTIEEINEYDMYEHIASESSHVYQASCLTGPNGSGHEFETCI